MTDIRLAARKVFLDTEVYIGNVIDFSNETFLRLQSLVSEGKIELFTSPVTINEIKANIADAIRESKKAVKEFRKNAKYLRNSRVVRFNDLWVKQDYEILTADLYQQVDEYLEKTGTRQVQLDGINVLDIFSKYFSNQPPFKEGEKKYEFPDAFVLASLELMSTQVDHPIFVISGDPDWKRACEEISNLVYLEKPDALFQLIEFDDRLIAEHSEVIFNTYIGEISSTVTDDFIKLGFSIDGSNFSRTIGNENVNSVTVDNAELIEKFLIRVDGNNLIFRCNFKIHFRADVEFEDYSYASYDTEEGQYYGGEWIDSFLESTENFIIEVVIEFTREEPIQSRLAGVEFQIEDVDILLEDDEY